MHLIEKILDLWIGRMSLADKEALFEKAMERFFRDMTPEEKQQLIEKIIPKLLEDIDMKELLLQMLTTSWNGVGTEETNRSILDAMSKMASETGGKISEMIPLRIKKMLRETKGDRSDDNREQNAEC